MPIPDTPASPAAAPVDPQRFRDVMGHYPTGVCAITAFDADGAPQALIVGTFTSVSLDPPLIGYLPMRSSRTFARLRGAERFVVNILAHDQEEVVRRLSRSDSRKMDEVAWSLAPSGLPEIDGAVAVLECTRHSLIEAGDHFIVLGEVQSVRTARPTMPLMFFRGGYGEFAPRSFVVSDGRGLSGTVAHAQALRGDLERAAHEFRAEATVFAKVAGDSVAIATAPAPDGEQITPLGTRYTVAPPIGAQYVAWADESEQRVWIDKAIGATDAQRDELRRHLADAHEWGWSVSVVPDDGTDWPANLTSGDVEDLVRGRHAAVTRRMIQQARSHDVSDISPDDEHRVIGLMAPIFLHPDAAPELMVRLLVYPTRVMTGREIIRAGRELTRFAERCSERLRGALERTTAA